MMTRKDFEAIASALQNVQVCPNVRQNTIGMAVMDHVVEAVVAVCAESNERFDKNRFRRECWKK